MKIELVSAEDAEELLEIYAPYVKNTAISLELSVPPIEEFRERVKTTLQKYPYLKTVEDGKILGYAYASPFKSRRAYDYSVETSIYVSSDARGNGIGKALYIELEKHLVTMGITNMNACIAMPRGNSKYLDESSEKFHRAMGFSFVGRFHSCAFKFDEWFDMIWMEKEIAHHEIAPKKIFRQ